MARPVRSGTTRGTGVRAMSPAVGAAVVWLQVCGSAAGQLITEDAGFKSAPDTPILQEWFRVAEYEEFSDFTLEHRLYLRFDNASEFRLSLPTILTRRVSFAGAGGDVETESSAGLGDLTLNYKLSLWQTDEVMVSNRWALLGEVTAPTGKHDKKDAGTEIPRMLQNGFGAWGFGGGTAFTLIRDRQRVSTEFMFRHWTRHDGYQPGRSLHWNLAYWYRLMPVRFDPGIKQQEVRAVIELLNTYNFESRSGNRDAGDQGLEVWIAPGLQWFIRPDLLLDLGLQVPIGQDVDDERGDRRWKAVFAVRFLL